MTEAKKRNIRTIHDPEADQNSLDRPMVAIRGPARGAPPKVL